MNFDDDGKKAIQDYQCCGCTGGDFPKCYASSPVHGFGCGNHCPGTMIPGKIFLSMPKGFNRLGNLEKTPLLLFKTYKDYKQYHYNDKFMIAVWVHENEKGHTLIRMFMPRLNTSSVVVILEKCSEKINHVVTITKEDIEQMN